MLVSMMRGVAVRVSADNTAGGFILPNDRVDVIETLALPASPSRLLKKSDAFADEGGVVAFVDVEVTDEAAGGSKSHPPTT